MTTSTPRQFSLDDWIEAGTVAQRDIEFYNDRAALSRYLELSELRRGYVAMLSANEGADAGIADATETTAIDTDLQAAWDALQPSKETWTVRALAEDEIKKIRLEHPIPSAPTKPSAKATRQTKTTYEKAMLAWAQAATELRDAADLTYLSVAILRMTTTKGTLQSTGTYVEDTWEPAVTVEQLKHLRARPGRQGDFTSLLQAAVDATTSDIEVPAPFSQPTSRTAPS